VIKSFMKVAAPALLAAVALSACGIQAKPEAGTPNLDKQPGYHGAVSDPRIAAAACLTGQGFHIREYFTKSDQAAIQVGKLPTGPTIIFQRSLEYTMGLVVSGQAVGAEAIGAALLYPNGASDKVLSAVEGCTSIGAPQPVLPNSPH
jgi:hypothetical protein